MFRLPKYNQSNNNNEVIGLVYDASTHQHIPFATVSIKGSTIGTTTDVDGRYSLTVPNYFLLTFLSVVPDISQRIF